MATIPIAEAGAHLADLIDRAAAGEVVEITRDGRTVARLVPPAPPSPRPPFDWDALDALHARLPFQVESAGDFVRRMRDEDRY